MRTAADPNWNVREVSLPYQVAVGGLLVVKASWLESTTADTPTFNGTSLIPMAHVRTSMVRLHVAQGAMYYLPVTAGQSGNIRITFPGQARAAALSAVTLAGATSAAAAQTAVANSRPSPLSLDMGVTLSAPATVLTLFSSSADIDSVAVGTGHVEHANPTLPLGSFHDARAYSGHAALGSGTHSLGYRQDPAPTQGLPPSPDRIYDAVMVAGIFR